MVLMSESGLFSPSSPTRGGRDTKSAMPDPLNLPALKARIAAETAGPWTRNLTNAHTDLAQCVEVIEALLEALEMIIPAFFDRDPVPQHCEDCRVAANALVRARAAVDRVER